MAVEPTPLAVLRRIAGFLHPRADFHRIGFDIGGMENDIRCALAVAEAAGEAVYVEEGWWHLNVRGGTVHQHPASPGRGWSVATHRLCEPVYTRRPA